jgi:UDP-N-acetylglucosamine 4,6-dehydratase (inverting)
MSLLSTIQQIFKDATILITGGSGSFGNKFTQMTLAHCKPKKIIIFCRDEMKQWEMGGKYTHEDRIRFFLGDVRDKDRLARACNEVDYIIHAAAGKIVPTAEYNPFEYVKTNVIGAMNIIDCAIDQKVKRVIALSTDKACNPVNLYGATKLCSDKLFIAGGNYVGTRGTRFAVVRYGNVMGSRGSIIPFFMKMAKTGEIPITDKRMTRFLIPLDQAVRMVWHALVDCQGGEIYVKKCHSMKVVDIAKSIAPSAHLKFVGIRPGEKLHEQLISEEDARNTIEYQDYFKILSPISLSQQLKNKKVKSKPCPEGFSYSSNFNKQWMKEKELQNWLKKEYDYNPL